MGWGEANYCVVVVKPGIRIFTSPWQEAILSCGPCSKGKKIVVKNAIVKWG